MSESTHPNTGSTEPVLRLQHPDAMDGLVTQLSDLIVIARIDRETHERTLETYREDDDGEIGDVELTPLQMHHFVRVGRFLRDIAERSDASLQSHTREIFVDCRRLRRGAAHRLHDWHIDAARNKHGERIPGPAVGSFVMCNTLPTEVQSDDGLIETIETGAVTNITGLKHRSPLNTTSEDYRFWAQILFG